MTGFRSFDKARATEFWICWRRFIWDVSEIAVERFVVVKFEANDASGNGR